MVIAFFLFAGLALRIGASDGWRYQHNISVGDQFGSQGQLLPGQQRVRGFGYDGQFYFFIAQDPFFRNPATAASLDNSLRLRRGLYPILAWALSLGRREWLPPVMVWINVLASTFLVAACVVAARRAGVSTWTALAIAIYPGTWIPILLDLTEPLQLALLAWGMLSASASMLLLSTLAKETSVIVQLTELARRAVAKDLPGAVRHGAAIILFGAWSLAVLKLIPAQRVTPDSGYLLDPPGAPFVLLLGYATSQPARALLLLSAVIICVITIVRLTTVRDRFSVGAAGYATFALMAGSQTWDEPLHYYRVIAGAPVLVFLSWVMVRDRLGLAVLALVSTIGAVSLLAGFFS